MVQDKYFKTNMLVMEVERCEGFSWWDELGKVTSDGNPATTFLQQPNGSSPNFKRNSQFFQTEVFFLLQLKIKFLIFLDKLHFPGYPIFSWVILRKHFRCVWLAKLLEQVISTLSGKCFTQAKVQWASIWAVKLCGEQRSETKVLTTLWQQ